MKTLIFTIATVYLLSCEKKPDFCKNGKCYTVEKICVKSHKKQSVRLQPAGKSLIPVPYTIEVCDKYIFKNKPFKK